MRIYTNAEIFNGEITAPDATGASKGRPTILLPNNAASGMPMRLSFAEFTKGNSPYACRWGVYTKATQNYETFDPGANFDSDVFAWTPNPAELSAGVFPSDANQRGVYFFIDTGSGDGSYTFDLTIEVYDGADWVPLGAFMPNAEVVFYAGSTIQLDRSNAVDAVALGFFTVEGGSAPPVECFWTDVTGAQQTGCDAVASDSLVVSVDNGYCYPGDGMLTPPADFVIGDDFSIAASTFDTVPGDLDSTFVWESMFDRYAYTGPGPSAYDPVGTATQGANEWPADLFVGES